MIHDTVDWDLLGRSLTGDMTSDEEAKLCAWLDADPAHQQILDDMRSLWQSAPETAPRPDIDRMWRELSERAGITPRVRPLEHSAKPLPVPSGWVFRYMKIAAVLLAVLGGAWLVRHQMVSVTSNDTSRYLSMTVAPGKIATIQFADGSTLLLDAGSTVRYPESFSGERRHVELTGEGYFTVTPNAAKPFVIQADHAVVRVLGTTFNVRAWPGYPSVQVVVAEGLVALSPAGGDAGDNVTIPAGFMAAMEKDGTLHPPVAVDPADYLSWRDQIRQFTRAPLREILDQIERWHDLDIQVSDTSAAGNLLTVYIDKQPVSDILDMLSLLTNLQYERIGRVIRLFPAGSTP